MFPSQLFGRLFVGHGLAPPQGYGYSFRLVPGGPSGFNFWYNPTVVALGVMLLLLSLC